MSKNKSYRIHTTGEEEYVDINLNINQDIDMFEMLTLKVNTANFYKLHTSNYGCVAGRVLANNAIGVPNVKLSIFIAADEETSEDSVLSYLYPYTSENSENSDGIRYNLLTEEQISVCHQNVGTFPTKRTVLDDNNVFEVFDKYYKFTTTTNSSGDYMIFGVPVGEQTIHLDVDLSDIGTLLSQTPRDFIYKGYDINEFESPSQFKKDKALDSLPQIISQSTGIYVHPFWGDASEMGEVDATGVRITRKDINLNYKFEPTCIFMGSIITDEKSNGFSERCIPTERMGKMDRLTTGEGTIEMIRKTPNGEVESFNVQGAHLIDGDGTWCYQIPMNLDFIKMDEFGNIIPTDDPNTGLPTRTKVRFRVSLNDFSSDYENNHLVKMLVPSNPQTLGELRNDGFYKFGTFTNDENFRDLLWNKVYSVKSFIPRIQKGNANREKRFSGIKAVNVNVGNNPAPYNNMRIDITLMFILQCAIMHTLIWIAGAYNSFLNFLLPQNCCGYGKDIRSGFRQKGSCITVGDGACPDLEGWYFAPNCPDNDMGNSTYPLSITLKRLEAKEYGEDGTTDKESTEFENNEQDSLCLTNQMDYFVQCIEVALAQEYEVIQFDFYNDWLNGALYIPRWFANVRQKRTFLWGAIHVPEKVRGCMAETFNLQRRYVQQCSPGYVLDTTENTFKIDNSFKYGCDTLFNRQKCHKGVGRKNIKILSNNTQPGKGFIQTQENISDKKMAYYFRPCDFIGNKRLTYFATDIILLGSVSENDIDGVPQAFKYLVSSTYKMPTNLAATNMDIVGRMYGDSKGVKCGDPTGYVEQADEVVYTNQDVDDFVDGYESSHGPWPATRYLTRDEVKRILKLCFVEGDVMTFWNVEMPRLGYPRHNEIDWHVMGDFVNLFVDDVSEKRQKAKQAAFQKTSATTVDDTFSNYETWASNSEWANGGGDLKSDSDEYPLTEAAGIDWGYTGPEQINFTESEKFKPGGHFLALSCFNSQSTVKSCVNLSRICEAGVSMSRRKDILQGTSSSRFEKYIVPTGVISSEEIVDPNFRAMFATLNYNRLNGEMNSSTGRFEYNFIPVYPNNFDGALYSHIPSDKYNAQRQLRDVENRQLFTKTDEESSQDYIKFRLGLGLLEDDALSYHFGISQYISSESKTRYFFPLYQNSFYFYFGLHDGATALDKFYEKFYAECPTIQLTRNVGGLDINVTCETKVVSPCNDRGSATFTLDGEDAKPGAELSYSIYKIEDNEAETLVSAGTVSTGALNVLLPKGSYNITFKKPGEETTVKYNFDIVEDFLKAVKTTVIGRNVVRASGSAVRPTGGPWELVVMGEATNINQGGVLYPILIGLQIKEHGEVIKEDNTIYGKAYNLTYHPDEITNGLHVFTLVFTYNCPDGTQYTKSITKRYTVKV